MFLLYLAKFDHLVRVSFLRYEFYWTIPKEIYKFVFEVFFQVSVFNIDLF